MIEGIVPREIMEGPTAIRATLDAAAEPAAEVAARLTADGIRRVFVIGNGTSLHSALASTLTSTCTSIDTTDLAASASCPPMHSAASRHILI